MKKIIVALGFMMAASVCVEGHNPYYNNASISIQTFYHELAPYGEWINTPRYGYAWRPYLDYYEEFRPYATRGNWVYTDLGWTWVSDYRWGWATFHYGRWFYDDYFGWMWLPGYEWAPSWVTWGYYENCWAWAPMGPNMYTGIYYDWHPPDFWWTFVPFRHFGVHNWHTYVYRPTIRVNNITYITNVYNGKPDDHSNWTWNYGPRVAEVEKHTRTKVQRRTVVDAETPENLRVKDNKVAVYRPVVEKTRESTPLANSRTVNQVSSSSRTVDPGRITTRDARENTNTVKYSPPKQRTTSTSVEPVRKETERTTSTRVEPIRKESDARSNTRSTLPAAEPARQVRTTSAVPTTTVKQPTRESSGANTPPSKIRTK